MYIIRFDVRKMPSNDGIHFSVVMVRTMSKGGDALSLVKADRLRRIGFLSRNGSGGLM
jgi:hypothetical protein